MNRKQKKEQKRLLSTRQLMGIDQFTENGLKVGRSELVFFLIQPDNLSVLSAEGVRGKIAALTDLLRSVESVRLLALDSRESFQNNKDWYRQRMEQESNPALRELLRQDAAHLDAIQTTTASAREFALVFELDRQKEENARSQATRLEKSIRDKGFHVRQASQQDLMRLLAVYYQQDVTRQKYPWSH
ncbi:MAG: hypothetical protein K2O45_00360, partial [Oscillospiraceae bacterium]|nr:hypothetical protein [Oscillospiraceae bacterium]